MSADRQHALRIDRLAFAWAKPDARAWTLRLPHLTLPVGTRAFLHGPSGSGKSTLLGLIGGVLLPNTGRVQVLGRDLAALSTAARDRFRADHLGIIFQQFNLLPYLSVLDNALLPCRFSARRRARIAGRGCKPRHEAQRLLRRLDLSADHWMRPVAQLSIGQQQRVAAARALLGNPALILADEPTAALDVDRQQAFLDLLLTECQRSHAALLFVSHDLRLADRFDRVWSLPQLMAPPT